MKPLTKSQQRIFDFLKTVLNMELSIHYEKFIAATGLKSTSTVHAHLKSVRNLGYISRDAGLNRAHSY